MNIVKTKTNLFGEVISTWDSHKHPDSPDFMQVVCYRHVQYPDGRNHLYWKLNQASANDKHVIYNITLDEAKGRFLDEDEATAITEEIFLEWLKTRKS